MTKILNKTSVSLAIFTVFEALSLRFAIVAPFHLMKTSIFPNDLTFNLFVLAVSLILAYFIGKLLIQKWQAKTWIKTIAAIAVILVTYVLSFYLITVADRYYIQQNYFQ